MIAQPTPRKFVVKYGVITYLDNNANLNWKGVKCLKNSEINDDAKLNNMTLLNIGPILVALYQNIT